MGMPWRGEWFIYELYDFSTSRYWNVTLRGTMMYESHVNVPSPLLPNIECCFTQVHTAPGRPGRGIILK